MEAGPSPPALTRPTRDQNGLVHILHFGVNFQKRYQLPVVPTALGDVPLSDAASAAGFYPGAAGAVKRAP